MDLHRQVIIYACIFPFSREVRVSLMKNFTNSKSKTMASPGADVTVLRRKWAFLHVSVGYKMQIQTPSFWKLHIPSEPPSEKGGVVQADNGCLCSLLLPSLGSRAPLGDAPQMVGWSLLHRARKHALRKGIRIIYKLFCYCCCSVVCFRLFFSFFLRKITGWHMLVIAGEIGHIFISTLVILL